jgi:membrane-associated protease RseP (regulator of RpoE activity)
VKKEGLLLLYKTSWGIKLINSIGKKYKKTIKILGYVSVCIGFLLMAVMVYLFGKILWVYIFSPEIVRTIKIPPIMPLIPYLPKVFNLDFLPPFYFIYWIIIIAIIAIPHELAHGIYSAFNKVRIKKTGFGFFPYFLPVFLAAFVEPDEKQMSKKSKFSQMSILSAGTFANILVAILFFFVLWIFFSLCFTPVGVVFDGYASSVVNVSEISMINNISIEDTSYENLLDAMEEDINEVRVSDKSFFINKELFETDTNKQLYENGILLLYEDSPAFRAGIKGVISEINEIKISSKEELGEIILSQSPGDTINISAFDGEEYQNYEIVLEENPENNSIAWLGIGFINREGQGLIGRVVSFVGFFKDPYVYYKPNFEFALFIYNLLWWIILISFSVALINMLPIGIFDGGRFFFLAIAAITGNEKFAKKAFVYLTYLFLLLLAVIMFFWFRSFL